MMQLLTLNYFNNRIAFKVLYNEKQCNGTLMQLGKLRLFITEMNVTDWKPLDCTLAEYQDLMWETTKFNRENYPAKEVET